MNSKIEKQFNKLETQKSRLLQKMDGMDDLQINYKPAPDQWSLGQVMYHLYLVEQRVIGYISKKSLDEGNLKNTGVKENWRNFLLHLFLKLPIKFKAPKVVQEAIPESVEIHQLSKEWQLLRVKMKDFLDNQSEQVLYTKIFKHPSVGYINLFQTMSFIKAHHRHHFKQINGLLSKIETLND